MSNTTSSKQRNFRLGVFVLLGLSLFVAGLVLLGVKSVFREYHTIETYFNESVEGLSVGSALKYRGVRIGKVEEISFCFTKYRPSQGSAMNSGRSPYSYVYVRCSVDPLLLHGDPTMIFGEKLKAEIALGLRFQLTAQGITGLSYIEADYHDPSPEVLPLAWTPREHYVPSSPSTYARISDAAATITAELKAIKFSKISENLNRLINTVDESLISANVSKLSGSMDQLFIEVQAIAETVRQALERPEIEQFAQDAARTMSVVKGFSEGVAEDYPKLMQQSLKAIENIESFANGMDEILKSKGVQDSLKSAPNALSELETAAEELRFLLSTQRSGVAQIVANLENITSSLKRLSARAEKHPSSLIFGDPPKPVDLDKPE